MKTIYLIALIGCLSFPSFSSAIAADFTNAPGAIGIYDSRAVAFAHFWSSDCQKKLHEQMAAAQAAKNTGDTAKFKEYATPMRTFQDQMHREVFSTAPADEAMAAIKDRIPEIEKQAGVAALISKWDEKALQKYPDARRVDVTDQLVHRFMEPTAKQAETISSIVKSKPIPLDECNELIRKGEI